MTAFYSQVLDLKPCLDVRGMTEFELSDSCFLGLWDEVSARDLLATTFSAVDAPRVPTSELYLVVSNIAPYVRRALECGAGECSSAALRGWGHYVYYCSDPEGHVLAFAEVDPKPGIAPAR